MEPRVCGDLVENAWLADEGQCDVVICVTENADVGSPIKKRICAMSARGDSDTKCESETTHVIQRGRMIKVHAVSKQLVRSSYFKSYLKESWNEQNKREGSFLELPLETCLAPPQAYQRCMELLCSSEPCSAHMFATPSEALDIYLASDHLLFKELNAVCMDYLASAQWSNEERKVIFEIFSTSGMKPSKDMAARLGLSKETAAKSLSAMLWQSFEYTFNEHRYGHAREDHWEEPILDPWAETRLDRFYDLLRDILEGQGQAMKDSITSSRKIIIQFLYRAIDFCLEKMKASEKVHNWWVNDDYFLGWLQMMRLCMDATDESKAVEAMACCTRVFEDLLFPTSDPSYTLPPFRSMYVTERGSDELSLRRMRVIEKVVKLVAVCFKRVAEMEIIVPESTRNSLIKCWVPWLEAMHSEGKICDIVDMPTLRDHVTKILQTLSMYDDEILSDLLKGALNGEYLLEGALKAWCERLD